MLISKNNQLDFIYFMLERRYKNFWAKDLFEREILFFQCDQNITPIIDYLPENTTFEDLENNKILDFHYTAITYIMLKVTDDEIKDSDLIKTMVTDEIIEAIAEAHLKIAYLILILLPRFEIYQTSKDFSNIDVDKEIEDLLNNSF